MENHTNEDQQPSNNSSSRNLFLALASLIPAGIGGYMSIQNGNTFGIVIAGVVILLSTNYIGRKLIWDEVKNDDVTDSSLDKFNKFK